VTTKDCVMDEVMLKITAVGLSCDISKMCMIRLVQTRKTYEEKEPC